MMYLATCRYRKVAFSKFLGCHAGRMMCPTRRSKACDLAAMWEMRQEPSILEAKGLLPFLSLHYPNLDEASGQVD
jgi:hypothetical protein